MSSVTRTRHTPMTVRTTLPALAALLTLTACREAPRPPPPASPRIVKFAADQTQIAPGATIKLTYEVENASEVKLTDDTGAFVELTGDVNAGEATVSPQLSRFYVLRATGRGGGDSSFVQV